MTTASQRFVRFNGPGVNSASIVAGLIGVAFPDALTALDVTPGKGKFWTTSPTIEVTRSTHDFLALPYADGEFDLVAYDPPHLGDLGKRSIMRDFGTYSNKTLRSVIERGACESWRVSRLGILVKVTDHVHDTRFQHESGWLTALLGTPYEMSYGHHAPVINKKWKDPACSAMNNGSTYMAFRKGDQRHIRRQPVRVNT